MNKYLTNSLLISTIGLMVIFGFDFLTDKSPQTFDEVDEVTDSIGAPTLKDVNATRWVKVENGIVTRGIVADYDYIISRADSDSWIATYKDRSDRGNYAGVGYIYDVTTDQFLPPKTYDSWVASTTKAVWDAPINKPKKPLKIDEDWSWDEAQQNWTLIKITNYASSSDPQ